MRVGRSSGRRVVRARGRTVGRAERRAKRRTNGRRQRWPPCGSPGRPQRRGLPPPVPPPQAGPADPSYPAIAAFAAPVPACTVPAIVVPAGAMPSVPIVHGLAIRGATTRSAIFGAAGRHIELPALGLDILAFVQAQRLSGPDVAAERHTQIAAVADLIAGAVGLRLHLPDLTVAAIAFRKTDGIAGSRVLAGFAQSSKAEASDRQAAVALIECLVGGRLAGPGAWPDHHLHASFIFG